MGGFLRFLVRQQRKAVDIPSNIRMRQQSGLFVPDREIKLEPGEFSPILSWELRDANGELVRSAVKKADSFMDNFLKLMYLMFAGEVGIGNSAGMLITATNGNTYPAIAGPINFDCDADINIETHGIVVGSGNLAVAFNQTALQTRIVHGVGAGQLQYSAATWGAPTSDGVNSQFRATRVFANGSGAQVDVSETAMYARFGILPWNIYQPFTTYETDWAACMILRDLLPGAPVAIPNGMSLTVNYQEQCAV